MKEEWRKYFRKSKIMMLMVAVVSLCVFFSAVSTISLEENDSDEHKFDVNRDGCCDLLDLDIVAANFGETSGPCDVNHDSVVDGSDLELMGHHCQLDGGTGDTGNGKGATDVSIVPLSQTVDPGETFTVDVNCTPGQPIRSFQFSLSFNASLIQANSVTNVGEIFTDQGYNIFFSSGTIDNTNGDIAYVYAAILMTGNVSSPGRFATISFTAQTQTGISDLDLYGVSVTNETDYVPINVYNGTVQVAQVDAVAPEITDVQATPSIQNIGGYVNISGTVIDNIEVDEVYLHIEYPDSSIENFSITQNKTGDTYYCNKIYQEPGVYTYHIWANDTSGNHNVSTDYTFEIINQPPNTPSSPNPTNGATGVSVTADLSWIGGDPDPGDTVTYDVYFEANDPTPDVLVSNNQSGTTYDPGTMNGNTQYYWQIVSWDNHGASTTGPIWSFTTENNPPYTPSSPTPANHATGVDINANLYWIGGDPDPGDTVTYDVYFGISSSPPMIVNNQSATIYNPGTMNYNTEYYWKIVSWDNHGASTTGPIWDFTTGSELNDPPNPPSDPSPDDGATDVSVNTLLGWNCSDPDGDPLVYDVYLEADDPTPDILVSDDQTGITYDPDGLEYDTAYYWQIIAKDSHSATTPGPVWSFTTEEAIPDLDCDGSLSWTDVPPGSTVTGNFTVENNGDPTSLLDWEVKSYPEWGTWTFTPENGDDLTPEHGPFTIEVSVVAPDEKNQQYTGQVTIANEEDSGDTCTISVSLATPVSVNHQIIIHPLLQRILELFPNAFPILRHLLRL